MLKWLQKRRIEKLLLNVKEFVSSNYQEPVSHSSTPKKTIDVYPLDDHDNESSVRYSIDDDSGAGESGKIKYSLRDYGLGSVQYQTRDNYNSMSIDNVVRNLSATESPLKALKDLDDNTNMSFVDKMLSYINIKHMRDSDVYKAAQIDRRLFSKIVSDRTYKPSKDTCIALSLALKLSLSEANDILSRAGYALSHSSKRDVVIEYFFREHIYNLADINEILFHLEQKLIGR